MAQDYNKLVDLLATDMTSELQDGVQVVIKPVPDRKERGVLDPRVLAVTLKQQQEHLAESVPFSLEAARAGMGWVNTDLTTTVITTEEVLIPSVAQPILARIYRPQSTELLPAVVYFHGGGFFGGTLEPVEHPCRLLAERANVVVISVDYRLAPEHPFPAGLNDCFTAVTWVYEQAEELGINRTQLAVAGDSAGGNLATVCALLDREQQTQMIQYQVLLYPVVNLAALPTDDFEWRLDDYDINENQEIVQGIVTALEDSDGLLNRLYLQGTTDVQDPHVSPLFSDKLAGLPEALIITAEYDYLRLEGEAYGRKLARAGVKTKRIQYNGMDHAFIEKLGQYPQAEDCITEIANGLKGRFAVMKSDTKTIGR
ncbi:alpha/beta hydrolase [Exiguobacterium antarcticum]|uniref:alpha/beta hydrolase n=1 Tax=Exiguobacterium antarcticum TaxID=132920 RepID=UPI000285E6DC|nr:alpha/beta hydrolase [Exiguobacterium antarcticum]AFS71902.1 Alpha/beta hydrolase fold-3 domain protein [Exiguobacterium antarcticum B7]